MSIDKTKLKEAIKNIAGYKTHFINIFKKC